MDWDAARVHCKEKNWKWTLDLIDKYQKEMEELKDEIMEITKASRSRLYSNRTFSPKSIDMNEINYWLMKSSL